MYHGILIDQEFVDKAFPESLNGRELKIPEEQLDFWPNRFQDERHYFSKEDFK